MTTLRDLDFATEVASGLLSIKAVKLSPDEPFTWSSGLRSPIYCDNRKALSYEIRNDIAEEMTQIALDKFPELTAIVGVATGAIAWGTLVASEIDYIEGHTPFAYVRSSKKEHGLGNQIEGDLPPGSKVVVIEDLISTGGSSLKVVQALRDAGHEVLGMIAIFSYGFEQAEQAFKEADCELYILSDYTTLLETAVNESYVDTEELAILRNWREVGPAEWSKKYLATA